VWCVSKLWNHQEHSKTQRIQRYHTKKPRRGGRWGVGETLFGQNSSRLPGFAGSVRKPPEHTCLFGNPIDFFGHELHQGNGWGVACVSWERTNRLCCCFVVWRCSWSANPTPTPNKVNGSQLVLGCLWRKQTRVFRFVVWIFVCGVW